MDKEAVFSADFKRYLTDGFNKWLRFNVTDCSADFGNNHVCVCFPAYAVNKFLDFIRNVRNNLYCRSEIFTTTFLIKYVPLNLTGGEVGVFIKIFINETFVMSEIKVSFGAVLGNIYFTVLIGAHCTGINIDVRIKLLCRNLETACF